MFVISIIIKISWIVLPFQNADNNCLMMYDTLAQEKEQGSHTNVVKTYDAGRRISSERNHQSLNFCGLFSLLEKFAFITES